MILNTHVKEKGGEGGRLFSSHRIIIRVYNFSSKLLGDEEAAQGEGLAKSNGFNIRQGCVGAGCSTRWGCQLAEVFPCSSRAEALLPTFYRMGSETSAWAFSHCHRTSVCVVYLYLPRMHICTEGSHLGLACTHTPPHPPPHMLQMLKETLPARRADAQGCASQKGFLWGPM